MRRLQGLATTIAPPTRRVPARPWPRQRGSLPAVASAILGFGIPVGPPGRPVAPGPEQPHGTAAFGLHLAVVGLVLFFLPTIMVLVTHAVTSGWQRLATHAARHVSPLWFAEAVARGDFAEADHQAARFFEPDRKAGDP